MRKTTYFNTKRWRCGHLFQGRFKAILIEKEKFLCERKLDRELPALSSFQRRIKIEDIENVVDRVIIDNARLSRNVKIYLSHRHTGEKLGSMGGHFDIGPSAVCQTAKRFAQRIKDDKKTGKVIQKIDINLSKV